MVAAATTVGGAVGDAVGVVIGSTIGVAVAISPDGVAVGGGVGWDEAEMQDVRRNMINHPKYQTFFTRRLLLVGENILVWPGAHRSR